LEEKEVPPEKKERENNHRLHTIATPERLESRETIARSVRKETKGMR